MSFDGWVSLLAVAGELGLGIYVLLRGGARSPAIPLALLSLDLFAVNLASLARELSGSDRWRVLYLLTAPLVIPLGMHLVLSFVGRRRQLRGLVFGAYAAFGAFALLSAFAQFRPAFEHFTSTRAWPLLFLFALLLPFAISLVALVLHLRVSADSEERLRTWLVLIGLTAFGFSGATELLAETGIPLPRLGAAGSLLFVLTMALVAVQLRLFEAQVRSRLAAFTVGAMVLLFVALAYLSVFQLLAASKVVLSVATVGLSLALLALTYRAFSALGARQARLGHLATLGRFSAQMAHDLKNPLATMKGAFQFLEEERRRGHSIDGQTDMLELMRDQLDRVQRVVDRYQRLSRVEPATTLLDLNALVQNVLSLQSFASSRISVCAALAQELPRCAVDPDLVGPVLENLVQNAIEAMPAGGEITVRTRHEDDAGRIVLEVEDRGPGMDARTAERAFDDFFTTKAQGSGLGLSFVRRVVEAHGGQVALTSRKGWGTVVTLRFLSP